MKPLHPTPIGIMIDLKKLTYHLSCMFRLLISTALTLSLLLVSCQNSVPKEIRFEGFAQGSYYAVTYVKGKDSPEVDIIFQGVDSILTHFDQCASLWKDGSEICRVNRNEDFVVSGMFLDLFEKSQQISRITDGAFDCTVGPLVKRYGFSKGKDEGKGHNLTEEELAEIMKHVGWQKVRAQQGKIIKAHPDIQLDFNAIAQGYCSDLIARYLENLGIGNYLVDVGGEICGKGTKASGKPWIVGIEKPAKEAMSQRTILEKMELKDKALVTSGSYRKFFEENGRRFSHTVDPHTGLPIQHRLLSATILCDSCWMADGIATACMVWGVEKAQEFLLQNPGRYEGFLIYGEPVESLQGVGVYDSVIIKTWKTERFPIVK